MENFDENVFYVKKIVFIQEIRKNIFKSQFFENKEIDMVIYYDKDLNKFCIGKNSDINEKNIVIIYTINDGYFINGENVDFGKLYEKSYIKLVSNSQDEIKEILGNEIYITDEDYQIFYKKLLEIMEKDYGDDWLSFYLFIQDLIDENQHFKNYFNIARLKEYVKQKIESNDLKYVENIVLNFRYEDVYK